MKNLALATKNTMSSLEIAKLVSSKHAAVKLSIKRLMASGVISNSPLENGIKAANGVIETVYNVCKRDSYVVVAQLSPEFTGALVDRWIALENKEQSKLEDQKARSELKVEFRPMTDAVINSREGKEVKFYHFTTEADLINRIVFGCSSAKFKAQNDIEKNESLRDFLTIEQKNALISLQRANTVFLLMGTPYEERKVQLTRLYDRQHNEKLIEEHMRLGA
jgi:phage regulator Rha-like protein